MQVLQKEWPQRVIAGSSMTERHIGHSRGERPRAWIGDRPTGETNVGSRDGGKASMGPADWVGAAGGCDALMVSGIRTCTGTAAGIESGTKAAEVAEGGTRTG